MMCLIQLSVTTPHCGSNIFKQSYRSLSRGFGSRFANAKKCKLPQLRGFTTIWGMKKRILINVIY